MSNLKSTLRRNLGICRKIRRHVGQEAMIKLYHSIIESRITYAMTSWCFGNTTMKNSLQRSCDSFLKSAFSVNDFDTLRTVMKTKGLMTIDQLLFFEIGKLMFKISTKDCPECLIDLFSPIISTRNTRSRRIFYSTTPRIQLTRQSLSYRGNLVWEKIPHHVKYQEINADNIFRSFGSFKKSLKEFIVNSGDYDISEFIQQTRLTSWY